MKKMIQLLSIGALSLLSTQCEQRPKDPSDILPEATQEGNNTMGAIVEGTVFSAFNEGGGNAIISKAQCKFIEGGLGGKRIFTSSGSKFCKAIYIYIYQDLEEGKTYELGTSVGDGFRVDLACYNDRGLGTDYTTDSLRRGRLTVTKWTESVFAGIFECEAIGYLGTDSGRVIKVTSGRFDFKRKQ